LAGDLAVEVAGDHVGHGFRLRADEVGGEIAREQRIGWRATIAFCAYSR